jgi:ATP-dependent Lhr-like helicase
VQSPADALAAAEAAAERVDRLLRRHGFACRKLHVTQTDGPWRECYAVLTRMEWAGTVRRGYFVDAIGGSQFAVPGIKLFAPPDATEVIWLALLDPANIYAQMDLKWTSPDGEPIRVPRTPGSYVALLGGVPILAAVSFGGTLLPLTDRPELLEPALRAVPALLERLPSDQKPFLVIRRFGNSDVLGSPAEPILREAGLARDTQGLRLYRHYPAAGPDELPRHAGCADPPRSVEP